MKFIKRLFIFIVLLAIAGACFRYFFYDDVMDKVTDYTIEKVAESTGDSSDEVQQVLDQISSTDKSQVESIIKKSLNTSTLKEAISALKDQDTDTLKKIAEENLSDADIAKIMEIYNKNQ